MEYKVMLQLQKCLYINHTHFVLWTLVTGFFLYIKLDLLGNLTKYLSLTVYMLLLIIESIRIYLGYYGNLSCRVQPYHFRDLVLDKPNSLCFYVTGFHNMSIDVFGQNDRNACLIVSSFSSNEMGPTYTLHMNARAICCCWCASVCFMSTIFMLCFMAYFFTDATASACSGRRGCPPSQPSRCPWRLSRPSPCGRRWVAGASGVERGGVSRMMMLGGSTARAGMVDSLDDHFGGDGVHGLYLGGGSGGGDSGHRGLRRVPPALRTKIIVPELAGFLMLSVLMQMPLLSFFLFNPYLLSTPIELFLHFTLWLLTIVEIVLSFLALKRASSLAKRIYLSQLR